MPVICAEPFETLKQKTFFGREKDNAIYPISLANLVLHGIDEPHIWHGNTLTGAETFFQTDSLWGNIHGI